MRLAHVSYLLAFALLCTHAIAYARGPSKSVRESCLLSQTTTSKIYLTHLSTNNIFEQSAYIDDYDSPYYFLEDTTEIGYAENAHEAALLYSQKIYRFAEASAIPSSLEIPRQFSPARATWDRIREGNTNYLCVGFNFDGLGHSGSMQNLRGGFLLHLGSKRADLYYIEGDIRKISRPQSDVKGHLVRSGDEKQ
ncbi:hypothetical protein [Duganella fentianensis]|uniref:hypothetical protein n=1 Tax=Duganella fentianensis TaxID=2692177 RepID=UPI0032B210AE